MADSFRAPPRFVPTLTTVVDMPSATQDISVDVIGTPWTRSSDSEAPAVGTVHEQLLQRVLQRIDPLLEKRLGDAVSTAVKQQLEATAPRIRKEIEEAIRSLIAEALLQELTENTGSVPTRTHQSLG